MRGRVLYSHTRTSWPPTNLYDIEHDREAGVVTLHRVGKSRLPMSIQIKGRPVKLDEILKVKENGDAAQTWIIRLIG